MPVRCLRILPTLVLLAAAQPLRAADDPLAPALQAYEDGNYAAALAPLDALERQLGPSPRLESLRALALDAAGREDDAFKSLLRYEQLTRDHAELAGNDTHQQLLDLLKQYRARIEKQRADAREKLTRQRNEAAQQVLIRAQAAIAQRETASAARFNAWVQRLPPEQVAALSREQFALLDESHSAALAERVDERAFRIADFPPGSFHLGLSREGLAVMLHNRLTFARSSDPVLARIASEFKLPTGRTVALGLAIPVTVEGTKTLLTTGTALEAFAHAQPDFDLARHQPGLLQLLDQVCRCNARLGVDASAAVDDSMRLVAAEFDETGHATRLSFAGCLGPVTGYQQVVDSLISQFGRLASLNGDARGLERLEPATHGVNGARFRFQRAAGRLLEGAVFQPVEPGLKAPWILELRISVLGPEQPLPPLATIEDLGFPLRAEMPLSRRASVLAISALEQTANGLKVTPGGRPCTLVLGADSFTSEGDHCVQRIGYQDAASGAVEIVVFRDIDPGAASGVDHHETGRTGANFSEIILARPATVSIAGGAPHPVSSVPFYAAGSLDGPPLRGGLERLIVAHFPSPARATREDLIRLGQLLPPGGTASDRLVALLQAADDRHLLQDRDADLIGLRLDASDGRLTYLKRAANAGNVGAARNLAEAYRDAYEQSKRSADRAEMIHWLNAAAEGGDTSSMARLVDYCWADELQLAEHWALALRDRNDSHAPAPAELAQLMRHADFVRRLHPLTFEQQVQAYDGDIDENVIGRRLKDYATKEKAFTKFEQFTSDATGRKLTGYKRGNAIEDGPELIWVNAKGVIVGMYYRLGHPYSAIGNFDIHRSELRDIFGAANLTTPPYSDVGLAECVAVRGNPQKTIELLRFKQGPSYLKLIDHTIE